MINRFAENLVTVIGGAGYVGSVLVPLLLEEGYNVRIFDNFTFGRDGIEGLNHENLEIVEGDICDIRAVSDAIAGSESVVLLAATVGRRIEDISRPYIREVNYFASSVVLDAAIEHGVTRFVFASTDSVYGVQSGVMYETGTPDPVSLYSRLKLRMEEQVIRAKKRTFHPTALRIATCFGLAPRMRFDLVVNSFVRDAVFKKELTIVNRDQCRALVHVKDSARAILSCLKAHVNLISGQVFNVGSNAQSYQLHQLGNAVRGIVPGTKITIRDDAPDLIDYHLSCSKIQKLLDFTPRHTVEEAMLELKEVLQSGRYKDPYDSKYHNT